MLPSSLLMVDNQYLAQEEVASWFQFQDRCHGLCLTCIGQYHHPIDSKVRYWFRDIPIDWSIGFDRLRRHSALRWWRVAEEMPARGISGLEHIWDAAFLLMRLGLQSSGWTVNSCLCDNDEQWTAEIFTFSVETVVTDSSVWLIFILHSKLRQSYCKISNTRCQKL